MTNPERSIGHDMFKNEKGLYELISANNAWKKEYRGKTVGIFDGNVIVGQSLEDMLMRATRLNGNVTPRAIYTRVVGQPAPETRVERIGPNVRL